MTSAYGASEGSPGSLGSDPICRLSYIPVTKATKDGLHITIDYIRDEHDVESAKHLMNEVIEEGMSWPFQEPLSDSQFRNYFLSHAAMVARDPHGEVIGAFYCKPNFPGRCSHYCNGGFITDRRFRGRGVATIMAGVFINIARDMGFEAAFFNLVFTSNLASIRLWQKLGFRKMARLPRVGRLREGTFDAIQFYYDLTEREKSTRQRVISGTRALRTFAPRLCMFALAFLLGRRYAIITRRYG